MGSIKIGVAIEDAKATLLVMMKERGAREDRLDEGGLFGGREGHGVEHETARPGRPRARGTCRRHLVRGKRTHPCGSLALEA